MGKKDDLFAMKFMLPEQVTALYDHYYEKSLATMPVIEEDELLEMNQVIQESIHDDFAITVKYFHPTRKQLGVVESFWGWVQRIDQVNRQIKLVNDEDIQWISMDKIVKVEAT